MFHLLTHEMTVTLKDVYKIFRLLVWGTPMMVARGVTRERAMRRLVGPRVQF